MTTLNMFLLEGFVPLSLGEASPFLVFIKSLKLIVNF